MPDIKYFDQKDNLYKPTALGRNGKMRAIGLAISTYEDCVTLEPINTKGVGRCWIDIPVEDIPNVIYYLKAVYNGTVNDKPHNQ